MIKCINFVADDTNLFISGKDFNKIELDCNIAISKISSWMSANKLVLNEDKTVYMTFSLKNTINNNLNLMLNSIPLKPADSVKFLGVILDNKLNWITHIDEIYSKLIKLTSLFYKLRNKLPPNILKDIYFSMIHSKLIYGIEIYANTYVTHLEKLITLNNKILRILQFKLSKSHRADLYLEYNTLPINLLFKYKISTFIHKCIYNKGLLPLIFQNYLSLNNSVHSHNTRTKDLVHVSQVNKFYGSRSINILGARIWNNLPHIIASISSIISFEKTAKEYFLSELKCSSE